jgi:hypothetical protein
MSAFVKVVRIVYGVIMVRDWSIWEVIQWQLNFGVQHFFGF